MSTSALRVAAPRRLATDLRPARRSPAALLGVTTLAVAAAVIALPAAAAPAGMSVVAALLLAATSFTVGRAADAGAPARQALVGLALAAAAAVFTLALALPVPALLIGAVAAGVAVPAAFALLSPRAITTGRRTPRYLLPLPLEVSRRRRPLFLVARSCAASTGALLAAGPAVAALAGPGGAVATAVGALITAVVASIASTRLARPLRHAETAGAVLAIGALAAAAAGLVTVIANAFVPASAAAWVSIGAAAAAVLLASPRMRSSRPARLARPGTATYRAAVRGYDPSRRRRPAAASVARSTADVRSLVQQARDAGLPIRVHSTGHSAGSVAPVDGTALIRVLIDEPVTVDPDAATARIPAGAPWADVLEAAVPHGLGAPHGSSSHVGAVGYLLRGGLSFYGRARGVAVNSVRSIELVTAAGELITIDEQHDPELFWAVRGGGGGFGIVTAMTIRLFPLQTVATGMVAFEADNARALARAWVRWAGDAPENITTSFRVVRMPGLPGVPRDLQGRPLVVVDGVAHATGTDDVSPDEAVVALLERLGAEARPVFDSWRLTTPHEVPFTHVDPPMGVKHDFDHQLLRDLGDEGADAFVDAALGAELATAELRQLGGALGRRPAHGGALARYSGAFASFAVALTGDDAAGARARLDGIRSALGPWDAGRIVPTFAPDASRPQRPLDADAVARARAIRARIDPTGVFSGEIAAGA